MSDVVTEAEIQAFLAEPKEVSQRVQFTTLLRPKRCHMEAEVGFTGGFGTEFQIRLRESRLAPLDFSVILMARIGGTRWFRLRRYNGKSHEHTNRIERDRFYDFHIHYATERYQLIGADEDGFAAPTDRYGDLRSALDCLGTDLFGQAFGDPVLPF